MPSAVVGDSHVRTWPGVPRVDSQPKLRPVTRSSSTNTPSATSPEATHIRSRRQNVDPGPAHAIPTNGSPSSAGAFTAPARDTSTSPTSGRRSIA